MNANQDPSNQASSDGNFKVVAASIKEIFLDMNGWSVGDVAFGLRYLAKSKSEERARLGSSVPASLLHDAKFVDDLRYIAELVKGTYAGSHEELLNRTMLKPSNIIKSAWTSTIVRPSYYYALDDRFNAVVFAIRGTASIKDALTDLAATVDPFAGGSAHRGMVRAAQWFNGNLKQELLDLCTEKKRKLIVVGHSLGAGTAVLVTMLFRNEFPDIHCYAFAPPACVSDEICSLTEDVATSIVLEDDIVPRFSTVAVEELRQEVVDYPWAAEMKNDIMGTKVGKLAVETKERLSKTAKDYKIDEKVAKLKLQTMTSAKSLDLKYKVSERSKNATKAISSAVVKMTNSAGDMMSKAFNKIGFGKKKDAAGAPPMELSHEGEIAGNSPPEGPPGASTAEGDEPEITDEVIEDRKIAASIKMYPPGNLHHIVRHEKRHYMTSKRFDCFGHIIMSETCISDHYMESYINALRDIARYLDEH
eukprot:ANDGO_04419.mRNA.1 hypothetical protein AMSG_08996